MTVAVERLFEENAEPLAKKCIQLATKGDAMALRLSMERLLPPCKNTLVHFELPPVRTMADLALVADATLQAVAQGEISSADSLQMMAVLQFIRGNLEITEIEKRLQALEEQQARVPR